MSEIFKNPLPELREKLPVADIMWGALFAGVVAYDVFGEQTLSERFDEYLEHPVGKYVAVGAVAVTGAHLLNVFEHLDMPDPILFANDVIQTAVGVARELIEEHREF